MTKKRIFTYIFPSYLLLIVLPIAIISWIFSQVMYESYLDMVKDKLESSAFCMRPVMQDKLKSMEEEGINQLLKKLANDTLMRITVIDVDGVVLAESSRSAMDMENHANRPEIISAINGKAAFSSRYSSTLAKETMYYAIPLMKNEELVAVLRTSVSLNSLDRALQSTYFKIITIGVIIALVAIGTAFIISRKLSDPLEKLKNNAGSLAEGDFSFTPLRSNITEIFELSTSMNIMSDSLQERINEINEQKNELKLILGNMREGVIAIDLDDNIITINSAAKQILNTNTPVAVTNISDNKFEYSVRSGSAIADDNTKLHSFKETVRAHALHEFADNLLAVNQSMTRKIELIGLQNKIIDIHGTVLRDHKSETIGVLLVLNDITQVVQLENMRKNFAANVSHELKTPLTAIKGAVETLIEGAMDSPEDARKFLAIISKHSDRLTSLINDTMSLSKIEQETEHKILRKDRIKLKDAILTSVDVCREKAESKSVALEIDCQNRITLNVNAMMIEQALVNLIDNAIKFSPENDTVVISVSSTQKFVTIRVTDHGCGIPEKYLPHLFERFYRVDKGRSRQNGGTGLGLAIVKHIAQSHDGTVSVKSILDKETTFSIKLPV
jgi:two-component system, OmpR family, phosphate regulon sensor histidine kinase PhoR